MRGDSMKHIFVCSPVTKCIFRPKIIRAISENVIGSETLPNNKCIIHLIDIGNMNLTKEYLKSAWKEGSIGATNFYLIKMFLKNYCLLAKNFVIYQKNDVSWKKKRGRGGNWRMRAALCQCLTQENVIQALLTLFQWL